MLVYFCGLLDKYISHSKLKVGHEDMLLECCNRKSNSLAAKHGIFQ